MLTGWEEERENVLGVDVVGVPHSSLWHRDGEGGGAGSAHSSLLDRDGDGGGAGSAHNSLPDRDGDGGGDGSAHNSLPDRDGDGGGAGSAHSSLLDEDGDDGAGLFVCEGRGLGRRLKRLRLMSRSCAICCSRLLFFAFVRGVVVVGFEVDDGGVVLAVVAVVVGEVIVLAARGVVLTCVIVGVGLDGVGRRGGSRGVFIGVVGVVDRVPSSRSPVVSAVASAVAIDMRVVVVVVAFVVVVGGALVIVACALVVVVVKIVLLVYWC